MSDVQVAKPDLTVEGIETLLARISARKSGQGVREVEYGCLSCGATDKGRFFEDEPIAPVINCYSCGSGRGIPSQAESIQRRKGMFPVEPEPEAN